MAFRVLLLSDLYPSQASPSGGVFVSNRIAALRQLGVTVDAWAVRPVRSGIASRIATWLGKTENRLLESGDFADLAVGMNTREYLSGLRGWAPRRAVRRAADLLLSRIDIERYDVLLAHGMYMLPAGGIAHEVSRRTRIPFVVAAHGSDINHMMPRRKQYYATIMGSAARAIFVSEALRKKAGSLGYSGTNTLVIPNGVDTRQFDPGLRADARRQLGLGPSSKLVTFVGNLAVVKGIDRLPEIFARLHSEVTGIEFVVVGDGPEERRLREGLAGLPAHILGRLPASGVAATMAASDVLVLPSRNEGWPCVILEAYSTGTPAVGSDVGGVAEAIADSQRVVAPGDDFPKRFADAVARTLVSEVDVGALRQRALGNDWSCIARLEFEALVAATS